MNHDEHEDENLLPPGRVEIDALLDGEAVDKESLRRAFDDEGARDYLIDALLLRQMTREMGPNRYVAPGTPRGAIAQGIRWIAAGLILAAGAGSGYMYGQHSAPPSPPSSSVEVTVDTHQPTAAPQPTQVIRFEPGLNWTSRTRSN